MADHAPDRAVTQDENFQVVSFLAIISHIPLLGLGLSVLGWILCTISIGLIQWRVWHVDNTSLISSGIVWIGIWDVCFTVNPELANDSSLILCQGFTNENTSIPLEIFAAQDLLMLATVMEAIAIGFVLFALWSAYKKEVKKKYILFFFLTGGVLNIMSSVFIFIPVIWNLYSTMKNHSIVFPPSYYVPSTPKSQKVGAAIPVGLVAALLLLLSGILLLYDWFPKLPCKVHPKKEEPDHIAQNHKQTCPSTHLSARSGHTYPHCGSFLEIELWGPQRPFGSGSCSGILPLIGPTLKKNKVPGQGERSSFQIPIGPFPHRPSRCVIADTNIFIVGGELSYF